MRQVQDAIESRGEAQLAVQRRGVAVLLLAALVGLGLLATSSIAILRGIARHLRTLVGLNDELEHRVVERTSHLERERARAVDAEQVANQANLAKSIFLANMSHELRTPLNVIIGYTELVLEQETASVEEVRSDLGRVLLSGRHLLSLIDDTLDLARIDSDRMVVSQEAFRVSPMIAEVVASVAPLVANGHNELVVIVGEGVDQMCGDPARIRQCLYNLLSNAVKFTDGGRIDVDVQRDGDWVTFTVADTGTGIAPEQFAQLFHPFVQLDPSSTRRHGGTGLGLALTRRLCGLMGGDVQVSSVPDVGSRFTIRLPRERANAA